MKLDQMRIEYLKYALDGKKTESMKHIERDYPTLEKFTRLGCFRWALTHWGFDIPNGHFFFFGYGNTRFHISRKLIDIHTPLFSIYRYWK